MADHPNAFSNREALQLDQIRFRPNPSDIKKLDIIEQDHSLDAVAAHLTGLGIKFDRVKAGLDTAQVPTETMKKISNLPPGEPFVVPTNGIFTVNVVIGHQPIATDSTPARQAAVGAWRNQQFTKLLGDQLKQLKDSAKITYQNGFAPPPEKKPATAAGGAAAK